MQRLVVYERCELATELKERHQIPAKDVSTWVCIARYESEFNTSAVGRLNGDGSEDHGIFQGIANFIRAKALEQRDGYGCAVSCSSFEDDDLADDIKCAKRIKRAHSRLSGGNGFSAWAVYGQRCKRPTEELDKEFLADCFNETAKIEHSAKDKLLVLPNTIWPVLLHLQPSYITHQWYLSHPIHYRSHSQFIPG
ncbi:hypothetical protein J437_LFUL011148 [Ladona fulva]|uniref:lysozyme n=1 Tax=Ladona fulva TaxID=123851 RepID=A0A8K0K5T8_LADFU|nr:hypothetical protein J437_LFUL011148 [Ladona fulva]